MEITVTLKYLKDPDPENIGRSQVEFLHWLGEPTQIHISGRDSSRCRVIVTLLHGNEPSGLTAIYHLLQKNFKPAVDCHFFIMNTAAALEKPGFAWRMLPEKRDLNRCFHPPFEDECGRLAKSLLDAIESLAPEAVIDMHNTSGSSPSFGITTINNAQHNALVSFFTQRLIVTDLKLGALMEIAEYLSPTVTIEVGGALDPESVALAEEGLEKFLSADDVLTLPETDFDLEYFHDPVRLELRDRENTQITFSNTPTASGITLRMDIEHHNFGYVTPDTPLGYIEKEAMELLTATNTKGEEKLFENFHSVDGMLFPKKNLKLFMITTNADIARSDCLFYFAPYS